MYGCVCILCVCVCIYICITQCIFYFYAFIIICLIIIIKRVFFIKTFQFYTNMYAQKKILIINFIGSFIKLTRYNQGKFCFNKLFLASIDILSNSYQLDLCILICMNKYIWKQRVHPGLILFVSPPPGFYFCEIYL